MLNVAAGAKIEQLGSYRALREVSGALARANPPYQEPWRTQGDYRRDQRRAARLYWFQILSIITAMVSVVATTVVAIATIKAAAS